jgi:ABC-type antimicrobial peptide transport system permease subunit
LIASYLILFGVKSIKSSRYQIGVIKALGGNTSDISLIFVLNTLIVGIVASILSTLSSIWILNVANDVLLTSMETSIKLELSHYQIIKVWPNLLAIDGLIMVGISFISALLPVLFLKKIKPVEIIKAKE